MSLTTSHRLIIIITVISLLCNLPFLFFSLSSVVVDKMELWRVTIQELVPFYIQGLGGDCVLGLGWGLINPHTSPPKGY